LTGKERRGIGGEGGVVFRLCLSNVPTFSSNILIQGGGGTQKGEAHLFRLKRTLGKPRVDGRRVEIHARVWVFDRLCAEAERGPQEDCVGLGNCKTGEERVKTPALRTWTSR